MALAEYIWLDGTEPTKLIRSKTRIVDVSQISPSLDDFPEWSFDGSSTNQAQGEDSDCILKPAFFCPDPIRGEGNFLVLCEVYQADGQTPHETNSRAELRRLSRKVEKKHDPLIGFEQEYTLYLESESMPMAWFKDTPGPQGPYYCGVGANQIYGRELIEQHTQACLEAGLMLYGTNAEVMPGQWEFQIGHRGFANEHASPLTISDHLTVARWLLYRLGEKFGIDASLKPKPIADGDWNGAGMHTNFSTKAMRDTRRGKGLQAIEKAVERLSATHNEHIEVYGAGNKERLTGKHETASISEFKSGTADRGSSIRIPRSVEHNGGGYLEDRRPAANACPYQVSIRLIKTICEVE